MSALGFEQLSDGDLLVRGELTFKTAVCAPELGMPDGTDRWCLDLAGVTRTDSAGLAVIIEWLKHAKCRGATIRFKNIPEQMMAIAAASRMDHLLVHSPKEMNDGPR